MNFSPNKINPLRFTFLNISKEAGTLKLLAIKEKIIAINLYKRAV